MDCGEGVDSGWEGRMELVGLLGIGAKKWVILPFSLTLTLFRPFETLLPLLPDGLAGLLIRLGKGSAGVLAANN